jgi:tRNA (cmo5U34)-methyltransferase
MLEKAKDRFSKTDIKVEYHIKDYSSKPIEGTFDLVISGLSIHHLTDNDKEALFLKVYSALNPNGQFINADQVLGETTEIEAVYRATWLKQIKDRGVTGDYLDLIMERVKQDKWGKLSDQLEWLRKANFKKVNCWYQNFSFAVYSGLK